ncbi:Na+/H+ antiporter NhaC [Fusibacter ferrireducens]|uniref:Na+/H+ antiporter NhaC n=1 Tax=Fusibacter ferrireducens TaxID=2785058 RepID=A0ABR9ZX75_9FIRM|nr:Na+/H+ antiporter NhaC [Fusibacter ferrireducens]MBF4695057.1 Na+/H+ antiporter NhaC [Fusibacter ferrireducens]
MKLKTSLLESFILFGLIVLLIVVSVRLGSGLQVPLLLSWIIIFTFCKMKKLDYAEAERRALDAIRGAFVVILIILSVGLLIGAWIASGTVPTIIYYGLKMLSPKLFLPATMLICTIMAFATGTSYGSAGSGGIAMMGIGTAMGFPPGMVAGAVICGALFGDRLSPLSDSPNLAAAMANADLFKHIRGSLWTAIPPYILSFILFSILGLRYSEGAFDQSTIIDYGNALAQNFRIGFVPLLPIILVVVLLLKKMPAFPSISIGGVAGAMVAIFYQGYVLKDVLNILYKGFSIDSGVIFIDKLLNRGGISSMMGLAVTILFAIGLGGMLEHLDILNNILKLITKRINSTGSLVFVTLIVGYVTTALTCTMATGQVLTGKLMEPIFKERGIAPEILSRTLGDAGVLGGTLMPWHTTSIFFASTLGVTFSEYFLYVPFNYITPFVAIFLAYTGISIKKTEILENQPVL